MDVFFVPCGLPAPLFSSFDVSFLLITGVVFEVTLVSLAGAFPTLSDFVVFLVTLGFFFLPYVTLGDVFGSLSTSFCPGVT